MSRGVVYTTIICGRDQLQEMDSEILSDVDFICFSDVPFASGQWRYRPAVRAAADPRVAARYHKMHPQLLLPDYDWWLWLDGSLTLKANPKTIAASCTFEIGAFKHRFRDCAYAEAAECNRILLAESSDLNQQVDSYRKRGLQERMGLHETGFLFRRNTRDVADFNAAWWKEITTYTVRDQISLAMIRWEQQAGLITLPGSVTENDWCRLTPHKRLPHAPHIPTVWPDGPPPHVEDWLKRKAVWEDEFR